MRLGKSKLGSGYPRDTQMFRSRKISNVEKVMNEFGIDTRSGFGKFTLEKIIASKLQDGVIDHIDVQKLMEDGGINWFNIEEPGFASLAEGERRSGTNRAYWIVNVWDLEKDDWRYYHYYPETDWGKEVQGYDVS